METVLSRTLALLLLSVWAAGAGPTPTSGPVKVPKPFNLKKESYNFNSLLYWHYNINSITPYFQVEYKKNDAWTIVETCERISHNYCNLSKIIVDPYDYYGVQVKAIVGSEMSEYATTEFYLIDDGIIGPPKLNASVKGKFLLIDVSFPHVPEVDGKKNVGDYLGDLLYDISYGNKTTETDECDMIGCSAQILISNQNTYCFSAQGKSDDFPMTILKSEEICIDIEPPSNGVSNRIFAIVVPIAVVVIILLALFLFIIKKKLSAKSMLPPPLNSIARAVITHLPNQVHGYDEVCVIPPGSPEQKMSPEETEKDLNVCDDLDLKVRDQEYHSSVGETEQKADEDQTGTEESSTSNNNYYRTENSDSSFVCLKGNDVTEQEPIKDIKPVTNSFGYDKPHCPL
ncbi:interferon gamma receptor 1 [Dendropsophus ebraccatus]|uniref:interferon gamma receptor 1 n=1 Tax=Dendropsophus ebraccatus TaxID=150705 RepID=UPI0038317373